MVGLKRFPTVASGFTMFALGFAVCVCMAVASEPEARTWTDASGKFKIDGKFVEVSDGKVVLEREDGTRRRIRLDKLSKADQEYIKELQANQENPFEDVKPTPKKSRAHRGTNEDASPKADADAVTAEAKVVQPDWSSAKQILLTPTDSQWNVSIEAPQAVAAGKKRPVPLPGKSDFFEGVKAVVVNPVCRRAVVEYFTKRPGPEKDGQVRLFLCDLAAGKLLSMSATRGNIVPVALNDAGNEVLMRRDDFGFGKQDRLEVWRLEGAKVRKIFEWVPYGDQDGPARDVRWASYLGDDRLLTVNNGGKIVIWNAKTAEPLSWLQAASNSSPALSPDRRYLAIVGESELGMLDLQAAEVIALAPAPKEHFPDVKLAFTPRGSRLARLAGDKVQVYDTATGAVYREISLVGTNRQPHAGLLCPSEEHLLVGNLLIDIETQVKVWEYTGHEAVVPLDEGCWFMVMANGASALIPAVLPHPAAVEQIQKMLDAPDLFVLKPGATVKLDVAGIQDPAEREKARDSLSKKLEANGCEVGANGTVELVATTEMGQRREIAYRTFGRPFVQMYMFQEYLCRIKFRCKGQTAWEVSCGNAPGMVHLKEGETLQEFLQRSEHPNYAWFSTVELPKLLQKPSKGKSSAIGSSQVTISGLR